MPFCTKCGAKADDGSKFCSSCGTPIIAPSTPPTNLAPNQYQPPMQRAMPPQQPLMQQATPPQQPPVAQPNFSAPISGGDRFSRIKIRYCCPNGHAFNGDENTATCPTCGAPINKGGYIQMYRCGNYMGMAVGMGIYIDDIPYGHIGNKESLRICVPFGTHKVHVTHTTTRSCNDPFFTVSPEAPYFWCKARFVKAGFKIAVEPSNPNDMPTV